MPLSKYEKLLNKMRKRQSYINIATNSCEWSEETEPDAEEERDLSTLCIDDPEKLIEEAKKVKLQIREIIKQKMNMPKLYVSLSGELSCLNKPDLLRTPLKFFDVQCLLLAALSGSKSIFSPEWCTLLRKSFIPRVILVVVDCIGTTELRNLGENKPEETRKRKLEVDDSYSDSGLELEEPHKKIKISSTESRSIIHTSGLAEKWDPPVWFKQVLPKTSKLFGIQSEIFQADFSIAELFTTPLSKSYLKNINKENNANFTKAFADAQNQPRCDSTEIVKAMFTADKFDRRQLLLSKEMMIQIGYPLNIIGGKGYGDPEFTYSQEKYEKVTKTSPIFGVDCEMCLTKRGSELTMVSIVNENSEVIYTTFVKPANRILNYMTMYSGVTKELLQDVTITLKDVQKTFRMVLPPDAILVGHSLHCDLMALKLFHPYVIDTAVIYNVSGMRRMQPGLKLCSKLFLNRIIQSTVKIGHDPSEDASASLQLVKLKLSRDLNFGDLVKCNNLPFDEREIETTKMKIKSLRTEPPNELWAKEFNRNLFSLSTKDNRSSCLLKMGSCGVTYISFLESSPSTIFRSEINDIKELFKMASEEKFNTNFTVLHVKLDDSFLNCEDPNTDKLKRQLRNLDKRMEKFHKELPNNTFTAMVFTGSSSLVPVRERSNGIVLLDIKGQERTNFYSFRKL